MFKSGHEGPLVVERKETYYFSESGLYGHCRQPPLTVGKFCADLAITMPLGPQSNTNFSTRKQNYQQFHFLLRGAPPVQNKIQ